MDHHNITKNPLRPFQSRFLRTTHRGRRFGSRSKHVSTIATNMQALVSASKYNIIQDIIATVSTPGLNDKSPPLRLTSSSRQLFVLV